MYFPRPTETHKCKTIGWRFFLFPIHMQHSMVPTADAFEWQSAGMANMGYPSMTLQAWHCEHCGLKDMTCNGYKHPMAKRV
jgi:hypothetical protein